MTAGSWQSGSGVNSPSSIRCVPPLKALDLLGKPPDNPALAEVESLRATLDALGESRPAIEWRLRWAELHAPAIEAVTLVHRDFRTGNYMVDARGLTAVLDW